MGQVTEVVLTGGPCAGKSSALGYLATHLTKQGVRVLQVPETATLFISGGLNDIADIASDNPDLFTNIQHSMIRMQGDFRKRFLEIAHGLEGPTVILYDRAQCDSIAYIGESAFDDIRSHLGLSLGEVRDSYDAVVFLRTAALGAEAAYNTTSNVARYESPAQARATDARTLQAWLNHPHLWLVENEGDFAAKLQHTLDVVMHAAGLDGHGEIERRFLLAQRPAEEELRALGGRPIAIEQTYLLSTQGAVNRIRKRIQGEEATYSMTSKSRNVGVERAEEEHLITASEYATLSRMADPELATIHKVRWNVPYQGQVLKLDFFEHGLASAGILEVELSHPAQEVFLPSSFDIEAEITDSPGWANHDIARQLAQGGLLTLNVPGLG